ncbi:TlpA family protein disulfide reductase [Labilibaculum euxinus]
MGLVFGLNLLSIAQDTKTITVTPEKPVQGEIIQIKYNAPKITTDNWPEAVIYLFRDYQWTVDDLQFKKESNSWISNYKLPEDCGFFALKFSEDSLLNTDKLMDRVRFVMDKNGGPASGAYAAWGLMRSPDYGYIIPSYIDLSTESIKDTVTYYWISQEISYHQKEAAPVLAYVYAKSLKKAQMADADVKIQRCLKFLMNNPSEQNLLKAEAICRVVLGEMAKADSIRSINSEKYPSGAINRLKAYRSITTERDQEVSIKRTKDFLIDFPQKSEDDLFNVRNTISYDMLYQNLLIYEIMKDHYDALFEYLHKFSFAGLNTIYYKIIEIPHSRKDKTDDFLYPYAKNIVERILAKKENRPAQYKLLSPKEWDREFEHLMARTIWVPQANLLRNSGHPNEAMEFAVRAQKTLNFTVADLNEDLCHLLQDAGNIEELDEVLRKSIYNNQVSVWMIDLLKKRYVEKVGSEDGFQVYFESLKKPKQQGNILEKIQKDKRQGKMPEWEMTDAAGKKINSKELRGKTYVLDFWASWCGPCKASFPGMQLAVERFKNDTDVAFFFVDTGEWSANYKERVNKYITDKNYPFYILFDNKVEGAKTNDEVFSRICKQFTISGIPQKIFVDKNGNIQFISVGYNGSASELADDISLLVEETKKAGEE